MTGSINTLLDNRPQPQPTPTREGLFEIFSPIRSSCVYICVPSENTRLGVYVSSQYQYLSATFFLINNKSKDWVGVGGLLLSVIIVFYSTKWKVSFIDRHLGIFSNFWYYKQTCSECTSFILFLSFAICIVFQEIIRLIFISRKTVLTILLFSPSVESFTF